MSSYGSKQVSQFPPTPVISNTDIFYSQNVNTGIEQKTTALQLQGYVTAPIANSTLTSAGTLTGTETFPLGKGGLFQTALSSIATFVLSAIANGTSQDAGVLTGTEVLPLSRGGLLLQTTAAKFANLVIGGFAPQRQSIPVITAGQSTYATNGYSVGVINVFIAGIRLSPSRYQALDGVNVVITDATVLARLVPGMTIDVEAALTIAVSGVATPASVQALLPSNQPVAHNFRGNELISVTQAGGLYQSTLATLGAYVNNLIYPSHLTAATALTGAEQISVAQGGVLVQSTVGSVTNLAISQHEVADYPTLRSYTGPAGDIIVTGSTQTKPLGIAGTFVYDPTDLTSVDNGGIIIVDSLSRRWKRQYSGPIHASWFGVSTTATAAVNTTGLLALQAFMASDNGRHYEIMLPYGTIQYTSSQWLQGIRSYTVYGGPTRLQNVGTSSSSTQNIPLWLGEVFLNNAGTPAGYGTEVNGYPITTTAKFATSATFITPGSSANFNAGDWCLVYGYNQASSGYPPSMRYFEYKKILSSTGGVITFYEPLINMYRQDWPDLATDNNALFGAARILPLTRPGGFQVAEYAELNDLEFLPSPTFVTGSPVSSLAGSLYSGACIKFVGRRLKINGYYYPTQGNDNYLEDCWVNYTEVDKVINRVTFQNCEIGTIDNGPAANFIFVKGGVIQNPIANLNCRHFISEDTTFQQNTTTLSQIVSLAASCAQRSVKLVRPIIDNVDPRETMDVGGSQTGMSTTQMTLAASASTTAGYYTGMTLTIISGTGVGQIRTITGYSGATLVATVSAAWAIQPDSTSAYRIDRVLPLVAASSTVSVTLNTVTSPKTVKCAFAGTGDAVVRALDVGSILKSTTATTQINVSEIYFDGVNTVIEGRWSNGTPVVGEVYTANLVNELLIDEPVFRTTQPSYVNNTLSAPIDFVASGSNPLALNDLCIRTLYRNRNRITVPFVFFRNLTGSSTMRINVNGVVVGMRAYVNTAYTGAQSAATLIITRPSTEGTTPFSEVINLKTAGGRRIDVDGTSVALSGDTLGAITPAFCKQINFTTNNDLSDAPPTGYVVIDLA
jgi:hypothetical protein